MSRSIENHVAIVTGGASGIGFATAQKLKADGARIALLDLNPQGLSEASKRLGEDVLAIETDIRSEASVNAAIAKTIDAFDQIDIVINAAGIAGITGKNATDIPFQNFQDVVAVNLHGSFLISKAVLPHMQKRNYGRILLIASIAGKEGNAGMVSYSASKAGIIGLAKSIGKEYAETGITINSLAPAVIMTPIHDTMPQEQIDYMTERIPMKRCGTLEETASAIRFIVSPENSFTTGFCYDLSGGRATY